MTSHGGIVGRFFFPSKGSCGSHSLRETVSQYHSMEHKVNMEIEEKIKQILITDLEVNPAILAGSESTMPLLGRGIGIDSVETLVLVAGIEREFDIVIQDEDLTANLFESIATLADYVARRVGSSKPGSTLCC